MRFADLNNFNRVTEVRTVDFGQETATSILLVDGEECGMGMTYLPDSTPRFQAVFPPPPAPSWTAFQFLLRFTEAEREGFRAAALTDPKVADFIQLCGAASEVEANHPMTVAGMEYLVDQGLLTQARAYEVLGL